MCKNRHWNMDVPKNIGNDVVLPAYYLNNHMALAVLNGGIPYHILYSLRWSFSFTFKDFWMCLFFHGNHLGKIKFAQAFKCIFWGYSSTRGYKCYCPHMNTFYQLMSCLWTLHLCFSQKKLHQHAKNIVPPAPLQVHLF